MARILKKERKLGSKFTHKGKIAIVTETVYGVSNCINCIFSPMSKDCVENRCMPFNRKDEKDVYFKYIENVTKIKADE